MAEQKFVYVDANYLKELEETAKKVDYYKGIIDGINMVADRKTEPKRGEWKIEKTESVWGKCYMLTCSECGETVRVTEKALPYEHFCRNCGADMREREGE